MKKTFLILMVLALCFAALGCSKGGAGNTAAKAPVTDAGVFPITNEKITLTAFAAQQGIVEDLKTNYATKWLEDKTNIHIEWNAVPAGGEAQQKMSVIINSGGKLPDFFIGDILNYNSLYQYGSQGVFYPINELVSVYKVNILLKAKIAVTLNT